MATSVVNPRVQFFANNGRPLIGGRIHTYVAGSSTRARTYKDAAKAQPNTNPIILDGRGEAQIYLAEGVEYKFVVEDSKGALIYTQEPVYGAIWPNAEQWPSDATLSYQYMTEAKAAAGSIGPLKFYDTYAQAMGDVAGWPAVGQVEIARDETNDGARTRYKPTGAALDFVVNLDQLRDDITKPSGQIAAGGFDNYARLRAYIGAATRVEIIGDGVRGWFKRTGAAVDDGGCVIVDGLGRSWEREFDGLVDPKWFGAVGNYIADDTAAIEKAFSYCAATGIDLMFGPGVYRVTKSLRKPAGFKIKGAGKPNFNITVGNDDKSFLRPGYKHLLPGSSIIWSGSQTETISMPRTDGWASFGCMLSTPFLEPDQISDIGLICDVDCFDAAGNLTTPSTDNRAAYDVGLVVDNSMDCQFTEISIFGYFQKKKGVVVCVRDLALANPDYNYFTNSTIFGGSAIIGYQGSPNAGLSGTMFLGCSQYDQTYHNRSAIGASDYVDQSVLYVDGQVSTAGGLGGVKIIGGCLRGQCPNPIQLDRVNDLSLVGVTTEFVLNDAYTGQTLQHVSGTANTERIVFSGVRTFGSTWAISLRKLQSAIKGPLIVDENFTGLSYLFKNGMGVAYGASDELSGDPVVQLTRAGGTSVTQGWNLRVPTTGELSFRNNNATKMTLNDSGILGVSGAVGKSGASSAAAPALLPYSLDAASGFYRSPSLIGISIDGEAKGLWTAGSYRPGSDNAQSLGLSNMRWSVVYAGTGTINTSDAREKTEPQPIPDAWLDAWGEVQLLAWQWLNAVAEKGVDSARIHTGPIAQHVRDAMVRHGVMEEGSTNSPWAGLCYDAWDDEYEDVTEDVPVYEILVSDNGVESEVITHYETRPTGDRRLVRGSGNRWGIRADQCIFLEAAYQRRERARDREEFAQFKQEVLQRLSQLGG